MAVFCAAAIGTTIRTTAARRIATTTGPTTATTTTGSVARRGVSQVCRPECRPSRWRAACPESPNRIPALSRRIARETNANRARPAYAAIAPAGRSYSPARQDSQNTRESYRHAPLERVAVERLRRAVAVAGRLGVAVKPLGDLGNRLGIGVGWRPNVRTPSPEGRRTFGARIRRPSGAQAFGGCRIPRAGARGYTPSPLRGWGDHRCRAARLHLRGLRDSPNGLR